MQETWRKGGAGRFPRALHGIGMYAWHLSHTNGQHFQHFRHQELTWDQALFSFRFVNNILKGDTKREPHTSLLQNVFRPFLGLAFAKSANQNYFRCMLLLVCKFFTRGKNADLLLKKVSTVTFNFLRD